MAIAKNQHFVPRFYLRNFSFRQDNKSVSVWVIDSNKFIKRASISNQACREYFYGQDLVVENAFHEIETFIASVIKSAIIDHILPPRGSELHSTIVAFIISLSLRTKFQAEMINESSDKLFKTIYRNHPDVRGKEDSFFIASRDAPRLALQVLEASIALSLDLNCKLLLNNTSKAFITSDNPVIKHNQLFIRDKETSHLGFASSGLQILLPLNPRVCLLFFDQNVYRVGNRQDSLLHISDTTSIDIINEFQYINADKALYFDETVEPNYIRVLSEKVHEYRRKSKAVVNEYDVAPEQPNTSRSIIHVRSSLISKNLDIRGVRILKKAKSKLSDETIELYRNKRLANMVYEQYEEQAKSRQQRRSSIHNIES